MPMHKCTNAQMPMHECTNAQSNADTKKHKKQPEIQIQIQMPRGAIATPTNTNGKRPRTIVAVGHVRQWIPHSKALEVDGPILVVVDNVFGQRGQVVPTVTFGRQEELVRLEPAKE